MKKFAFINDKGEVLYTAQPSEDSTYDHLGVYAGLTAVEFLTELDDYAVINYYYWDIDTGWMRKPVRPSEFHVWNTTNKDWELDSALACGALTKRVEDQLEEKLYLPCNGFDADKVSRDRISGMIARLQRGDGLPAGWMGWRDASNQQHWSQDDAATVLANLTALSRAIEDREQALLVASWTHKANIAALDDIDAILAYDVTANWPV